jgi:hypothetical protein
MFAERAWRNRRSGRRTTMVVTVSGAGALGGIAYVGWKVRGRMQPLEVSSSHGTAAQPAKDSKPPSAGVGRRGRVLHTRPAAETARSKH